MAKHPVEGFGADSEHMQAHREPAGKSAGLPGKPVKMGQHSKALPGFADGHDGGYPYDVEPHVAHSPRTHHGDL